MSTRDLDTWAAAELTRLDARHSPPWRDAGQSERTRPMSSTIYGPKERSTLATLADQLATAPGSGVLATTIADKLRTELPDVDDLTIGRVLVALAVEMPTLFTGVAEPHVTWQGLAAAGLSMTEPEWKGL